MPITPELYIHCDLSVIGKHRGRWPVLERVLGRANRGHNTEASGSALPGLCHRCSGVVSAMNPVPVAALSLLGEGLDPDRRYWLRADPVQLVPNRDQLIMAGSDVLQLSQAEAESLVQMLRELYTDTDWRWELGHAQRWYLGLNDTPDIMTVSPDQVLGEHVLHHVPQGADGLRWHALMNEIQAALHLSPVNEAREQRGLPPVNSVWFWGGGRLRQERPAAGADTPATPWDYCFSEDPLVVGLARFTGVPVSPLLPDAASWLVRRPVGNSLLDLSVAALGHQFGNPGATEIYLDLVHEHWLHPLVRALGQGGIDKLLVSDVTGRHYSIGRWQWRQWWKRQPVF